MRFLIIFCSVVLTCYLGVGIFNVIVDPYQQYEFVTVKNFNENKPTVSNHVRLYKADMVTRIKPQTIIIGNSRCDTGLSPNYLGWENKPVYNMSLPSATIYEIRRYVEHAHSVRPLKHIVLCLEDIMFASKKYNPGFSEDNLNLNVNGGKNWGAWLHRLSYMFSFGGTMDSIKTIRQQDEITAYSELGQRKYDWWLKKTNSWGGVHNLFNKVERSKMKGLLDAFKKDPDFLTRNSDQVGFEHYRSLLKTAYRDNIKLTIVITPSHARLEEIRRTFSPAIKSINAIVKDIIKINEQISSSMSKDAFIIYDFSGYNDFTTEKVPEKLSEDLMNWYWEVAHFKAELGDVILDRIFSKKTDVTSSDFGMKLTSENIQKHFSNKINARLKYQEEFAGDILELKQLVPAYFEEAIKQKYNTQ